MNNGFDDFSNVIDGIEVERKRTEFKLIQLKLEHYHWNSGDIDGGMPISTSIELTCQYDFAKDKLDWTKTIAHTYLSLDNCDEEITNTYTEELSNPDVLIKKLEQIDLRDLKNNYFTEENPDRFTHWEITYNNYFKIVGTYDQEIEEFKKISEILELKKVIKEEIKKVQNKRDNA